MNRARKLLVVALATGAALALAGNAIARDGHATGGPLTPADGHATGVLKPADAHATSPLDAHATGGLLKAADGHATGTRG
ncbi:hypothetical protein JNUCC64_13495 [Streptomyces sp. JNUCC 64]